jgi:hypothetical protein
MSIPAGIPVVISFEDTEKGRLLIIAACPAN